MKKIHRVLSDNTISWKAKGLFSHIKLIGNRDDFSVEELMESSSDGRDATRGALNELIESGYVNRERQRDHRGVFKGVKCRF